MVKQNEMSGDIIKIVSLAEAGKIQKNAESFNCFITDIAVAGGANARVSLKGSPTDISRLIESVKGDASPEG